MKPSFRKVLDAAASRHVPDDINLFPGIAARLERKTPMQSMRARPVVILLAVLIGLGLATGVVYAVGRTLGYIPNFGLFAEDSSLRILAEPVVIEREGIKLTVTEGLISPEQTILHFQAENIPESALTPNYREGETPVPGCALNDFLRLPDGTLLPPTGGQGRGWGLGFEYREIFDPLPADQNDATLIITCLLDTARGLAPENWEIPLRFMPAPADMTMLPVIQLAPSPEPAGETTTEAAPAPSPIAIERTIHLEDGYLLIGSFHSITTASGLRTSPFVWFVRIRDARGAEVPFEYAEDIDLPAATQESAPWAYRIPGLAHAWPLTLSLDSLEADLEDPQASFTFDAGPAPQPEQQWTIDQDLQVGSYTVRALTAMRTPTGYTFTFQADPAVTGIGIDILGEGEYLPPSGGGGGGSSDGSFSAGLEYAGKVPEGELTVVIRRATVKVPGPWSVEWQPEDSGTLPAPTPSPEAGVCVTDEIWAGVRASIPGRIPGDLPGRMVVFGPDENSSLYGVNLLDLATKDRAFVDEGSWPVASPDGTRIIYTGSDGLVIYEISSGVKQTLPGTDPSDYRMAWSPDGARIAFVRGSTGQVMVINADGSGQLPVRDNSAIYHALAGWSENMHLLITEPGPQGVIIQSLDLADGLVRDLFTISSNKADIVASPDGSWIAYSSSLGGNQGNGLSIARLDGSEKKLVAALNGRALYFPVWSPDGRWLILSLPEPNDPVDQTAQALVELSTCRITRLPDVGGEVYSWVR